MSLLFIFCPFQLCWVLIIWNLNQLDVHKLRQLNLLRYSKASPYNWRTFDQNQWNKILGSFDWNPLLCRNRHIECSKQIRRNSYFYVSWAEPAVFGSTKTALKFKYDIWIDWHTYNSMYGVDYKLENEIKNPWFIPWFNIFCTHNQLCVPQYKVNV